MGASFSGTELETPFLQIWSGLNPRYSSRKLKTIVKVSDTKVRLGRLDLFQDDVLRFAYDFQVPFDNNQAERDVRMVKLQQKIFGCWRSHNGAEAFLDVWSYLAIPNRR